MIRTRFAPSPTGHLHLGNARTALFNALFARHHNGEFLLRIEDTDHKRCTQESHDSILAALEKLELKHNGPILYQSQRTDFYRNMAHKLLEEGKAYKCFLTNHDQSTEHTEQHRHRVPRTWRDTDPKNHPKNTPYTIRLKSPITGTTTLNDLVQGSVTVKNDTFDDLVLLRSDGTPTYAIACVCDDHASNITHVFRGNDHLTNTFRHLALYAAFGWTPPHYGHLGLIHDPSGEKLSKRRGKSGLWEIIGDDIPAIVVINALSQLGWTNGKGDLLSLDDLSDAFDGKNLNRAPSRYDPEKIDNITTQWIRSLRTEELAPYLCDKNSPEYASVLRITPLLQRDYTSLDALRKATTFLFERPQEHTTDNDKETKNLYAELCRVLEEIDLIDEDNVKKILNALCEKTQMSKRHTIPLLRKILHNGPTGPSIRTLLIGLGKDELQKRLLPHIQ